MSKQTVLGRVAQLARANINTLLDQAEDPQKMIDQLVREYTANIAQAQDAVADTIGRLRLMEHDHAEDVGAAAEWGAKAAAASRTADGLRARGAAPLADRFDHLARIALGRQLQSEMDAAAAEPTIAAQNQVVTTLKAGLDQMKARLDRLQTKREEALARSRSPQAQERLPDTVVSVDLLDPAGEIARFEEKVRREEVRAKSKEQLSPSSLDSQFESPDSVAAPAEVDARLARLKAGRK